MLALYLDIDGVLLTKHQQPPEGVSEFLDFVLASFDCYWLTTHCKGDAQTALRYLAAFYPASIVEQLRAIKSTNWDALKTDGIAVNHPFFWIDDYPFEAEKNVLRAHNQLDSLIVRDLKQKGELASITSWLRKQLLATNL
jgi:hypothetical protein